ncbi:formate dehydrogenase subunit alpha [Marinitenerispora sediminis]|uniref:formate dehydrogenase subunit alpha n=1 Tax=Marinitenerispora sediminis TaxID=1931232 RepID=UPI001F2456FC|nr:formate dehydrogenase subunit alpha [Marinitenerispora sediminis]
MADTAVELAEGATVLAAVRAAGQEVPTLCQDDRLAPVGSCRVCLVDVDGRVLPACTTPAADGMRVRPQEERARAAARRALELVAAGLPERALAVPADRSELVRCCALLGVFAGSFGALPHRRGTDHSHPYVKLDRDLCIACQRCVRMCAEVQGTFALDMGGRGFDTVVVPGAGEPWVDSPCVGCGGCVDSCPTGALSEPGLLDPSPLAGTTRTTCGYCGVGCSLDVHVRGGSVAAVTPVHGAPVNRGHACVKGRFAHGYTRARDRLTVPLLRRGGRDAPLEEASWEEAVGFAAGRLAAIRAARGPDAVAVISSARATNEENYLAQKYARAVLGTNSVDNCSRLCHAPSASGLTAAFGLAGGTNPFDDLDRADCFLVAGANPTEAHPVVGARIKQRVLAGAGLVVADPRRTDLADLADVHLRGRPGSNVAVFNGIAHVLLAEGLADEAFLAERASGLAELREVLRDHPPERVARLSGIAPGDLARAARRFGSAERPAILYGLGVTEHRHGTDGVRTLANLAVLTGSVGTEGGCGVLPLRGQNNVQGASDMGALPDHLPGYQPVAEPAARERCAAVWGAPVPERPGLRIPEMFDAAVAGRLGALHVIGEDIMRSDPDSGHVRAALAACELVVCQDVFLSGTAELADVVLPAASFLEKDGTFTNFERRVQRVRPAVAPPGQARSDFAILHLLAGALGADLGCPSPADALAECAAVAPLFGGLSHARLDRDGPLHWPCRGAGERGEAVLYLDRFATPDGRAALAARPYLPPGEQPDGAYPFVLVTGRRLAHYNTGSMTRRTANAELLSAETLDVHPADADRLGIADGDRVEVASRRGAIVLAARRTDEVAPGELFTAFHFPDAPANVLTSGFADTVTGCPEYKVSAVALRPAPEGPPPGPGRAARG